MQHGRCRRLARPPPPLLMTSEASQLVCIHEDADLLVLDKPSGLLCVPGRGPDKQDCLSSRAQSIWPEALIVHRLDQATSGLVIMARHIDAQRKLSQAFAERQVHKQYEALVAGDASQFADATGALPVDWTPIDLPIAADWERRPLRISDAINGKPSRTLWRLAQQSKAEAPALTWPHSRLQLQPITGRTHQLRVHLAAIGHPIAGDMLYADAASQSLSPRLMLHACQLRLDHPSHGGAMEFVSAVPF